MSNSANTKPLSGTPHPLLSPGSILSLWGEAADRLVQEGNGDAALLYLHILRNKNPFPPQWDKAKATGVLGTLQAMGLLTPQQAKDLVPEAKPIPLPNLEPNYSKNDINMALSEKSGNFSNLIQMVDQMMGKPLNENDTRLLLTLYNDISMPPEVISMLVQWCISEHQRKYGKNQLPSLSLICKVGYSWQSKGIVTLESVEDHIARMDHYHKKESEIGRILQISGRSLLDSEKTYITGWLDMGFDSDAIDIAYSRTIMQKINFSWTYCNGILKRWHEQGLRTPAQILAADKNFAPRPTLVKGQGAPQKVVKGPNSGDTMQGSAQEAPSQELSNRILQDRENTRRMMLQDEPSP